MIARQPVQHLRTPASSIAGMEDPLALLLALGAIAGASLAAYVTYQLGRGTAKQDRLQLHELDSVIDTRDRLLDVARLAEALANLEPATVEEFSGALRSLRYARARTLLISDDRLIDILCTALPELLRTFPDVSDELRGDLARLGNVVRESMFEQERTVIATGKPRRQTDEQTRRVDAMVAEVTGHQRRFRGWSKVRIAIVVWRRLTFGF